MNDGVYIRGLEGMRSLCWFSEDRSVFGLLTLLSVGNSWLHLSFRDLELSIGIGKYYLMFVGWLVSTLICSRQRLSSRHFYSRLRISGFVSSLLFSSNSQIRKFGQFERGSNFIMHSHISFYTFSLLGSWITPIYSYPTQSYLAPSSRKSKCSYIQLPPNPSAYTNLPPSSIFILTSRSPNPLHNNHAPHPPIPLRIPHHSPTYITCIT